MKPEPNSRIDQFRRIHPRLGSSEVGANWGYFEANQLRIMASYDLGWEHVSVSVVDRCPTWQEMTWVKNLFWGEEECVVQFHPPKAEYVNVHPFCLHLWKPVGYDIQTPPRILIG